MSGKYRVTRKRIVRSQTRDPRYSDPEQDSDGEPQVYEEGDILEPTDEELRAFGDRLAKVPEQPDDTAGESDDDSAEEADEAGDDDTDEQDIGLANMNVSEVRSFLRNNEFTEDELDAIEAEEDAGKERKSVYKYLEDEREG